MMTAGRAFDMNVELSITVATPEDAPLEVFGLAVSEAVARVLEAQSDHDDHLGLLPRCREPGGSSRSVPETESWRSTASSRCRSWSGRRLAGVPVTAAGGFIPIDEHCKVRELERVYAAGDTTDFAVKFGGDRGPAGGRGGRVDRGARWGRGRAQEVQCR